METLLAALTWEPQIKGALYVVLAVGILCGSCYMLLATNTGARLGFLLAAAGLFGFLATIGIVWWVYGIGPKGPEPKWDPAGVITGDLARSANPALDGFPREWEEIEVSDPAVADAQPVVDGQLVSAPGQRRIFATASDYVPVAAYKKGGESYGPLGLDFRPLDVFHKAHYLILQVQKVQPVAEGQPPPPGPPRVDASTPPVAVVMVRDLGALRLNPAIFAISSTLIFLLLCYQLHTRDRDLTALRESGSRSPEPVSR
ncbi:MAG: hypothetical protein ABR540_03960 [Acidimicrobiales bacterium]